MQKAKSIDLAFLSGGRCKFRACDSCSLKAVSQILEAGLPGAIDLHTPKRPNWTAPNYTGNSTGKKGQCKDAIKKIKHANPPFASQFMPKAWHFFVREAIADIVTTSAFFSTKIDVLIFEKKDGDLLFSASMAEDVDDETRDLVSRICTKANNAVPFVCVVSGSFGLCTQRFFGKSSFRVCKDHLEIDPI